MSATTLYGDARRLNAAVNAKEMTLAEAVAELLAAWQLSPAGAEDAIKDPRTLTSRRAH